MTKGNPDMGSQEEQYKILAEGLVPPEGREEAKQKGPTIAYFGTDKVIVKTEKGWRTFHFHEIKGKEPPLSENLIEAAMNWSSKYRKQGCLRPSELGYGLNSTGLSLTECWRDNSERVKDALNKSRDKMMSFDSPFDIGYDLDGIQNMINRAQDGPPEMLKILQDMLREAEIQRENILRRYETQKENLK